MGLEEGVGERGGDEGREWGGRGGGAEYK